MCFTDTTPIEPLQPGLDTVLQSPKRRSRPLTLDRSKLSSSYAYHGSSDREMSLDFSYAGDMSINQDVDLDGALQSPSRLSDFRTDHDSSSVVSWNRSPSLTFVFDDEEEDKSCVEMLIDIEDICESKNLPEWSDMVSTRCVSFVCCAETFFYIFLTATKLPPLITKLLQLPSNWMHPQP
jgi:hypothetical protein